MHITTLVDARTNWSITCTYSTSPGLVIKEFVDVPFQIHHPPPPSDRSTSDSSAALMAVVLFFPATIFLESPVPVPIPSAHSHSHSHADSRCIPAVLLFISSFLSSMIPPSHVYASPSRFTPPPPALELGGGAGKGDSLLAGAWSLFFSVVVYRWRVKMGKARTN